MKKKLILLVYILFSIFVLIISNFTRTPFFLEIRYYDFSFVIILSIILIVLIIKSLKKNNYKNNLILALLFMINLTSISIVAFKEISHQYFKYSVVNYFQNNNSNLGEHFIVGYEELDEIKKLSDIGAIGGIYISSKNVKNSSIKEIKKNIDNLQKSRKEKNLSPLFIAVDQEGGYVSHMSPPLPYHESLGTIIRNNTNIENNKDLIKNYAQQICNDLKSMGVNMNFAPVVDVKRYTSSNTVDFSQIWNRSISNDPEIISEVSSTYCEVLINNKIIPVLKHFPGLGRVKDDTHFYSSVISASTDELKKTDWLPYINRFENPLCSIMVGHVTLKEVDKLHLASTSKKITQNILVKEFNHKGLIITDDFSMSPVFFSNGGPKKQAEISLNAGNDIILVSFDYDIYYNVMNYLINKPCLDNEIVDKSSLKIRKIKQGII